MLVLLIFGTISIFMHNTDVDSLVNALLQLGPLLSLVKGPFDRLQGAYGDIGAPG